MAMPRDEDLEKLLELLIQRLPSFFSNLFGRKFDFKIDLTEEEKKEFVSLMKKFIQTFIDLERMKKNGVDQLEILSVYLSEMDSLQHFINREMPKDQHFVDWYLNLYKESLKIPSDISFLNDTRFEYYQSLLKQLLVEIVNLKRGEKADQFLRQMEYSSDGHVITQAFFTKLVGIYRYLERKRLRTTIKTIEKHIRIYGELTGHFEKLLGVIVGVIKILREGILPDYDELREKSLASKEWKLRKDPEYSDLIISFNRTIRNSIAHGNYVLLPLEKKIKFIDLKESVIISYDDFERQVKEFSSLVLVLSQIRVMLILLQYQILKKLLDRMV